MLKNSNLKVPHFWPFVRRNREKSTGYGCFPPESVCNADSVSTLKTCTHFTHSLQTLNSNIKTSSVDKGNACRQNISQKLRMKVFI